MSFWKKHGGSSDEKAELTPTDSPVSEALILICEKCGKKLSSDPEDNPSRGIQQALKGRIKASGGKGVLRPVLTSCMDVCPDGEIAVAISSQVSGQDHFFTLRGGDAESGAERILNQVAQVAEAAKKS